MKQIATMPPWGRSITQGEIEYGKSLQRKNEWIHYFPWRLSPIKWYAVECFITYLRGLCGLKQPRAKARGSGRERIEYIFSLPKLSCTIPLSGINILLRKFNK